MRNKIVLGAALFALNSQVSFAYAWDVVAHVVQIEPSSVPAALYMAIDQNAGSCAAGPWLVFSGNAGSGNLPLNIQAMYAGLLTALSSGNAIEVSGNNSGCTITSVHFLNHP